MDRVDFTASSLLSSVLHQTVKGEAKKTNTRSELPRTGKTLFSGLLDDLLPSVGELGPLRKLEPSEEALTELMDAVHSTGSDLLDRPFADEILRYKKAVRNFIHYVVHNSFDVERIKSLVPSRDPMVRRRGETKINVQIQVIDRKLEELAADLLSRHTTQLERVSKLDDITGLLIDLTITGAIKE